MNLRTARAAVHTDVSIPSRGGDPRSQKYQLYPHVPVGLVQKKGREYRVVRRAACAFVKNDRYLQRLSCLLRTSCDSPCLRTS